MLETIRVTEDDIREANLRRYAHDYNETCDCPIAQAVRRRHPSWLVQATYIDAPGQAAIQMPFEATLFVNRFDHEMPVQPIEFDVEIPD